jgi:hypothetical protein
MVNSEVLNMREGPNKETPIVFKLSKGDLVDLLEKETNGWWLVEHDNNFGYVYSSYLKKDEFAGWERTNYKSGTAPECENVVPKYDYEIDNYLKINVGSNTDVIVKLMKIGMLGGECIRIAYIRANDSYSMKNIPEGKYYLKIAYGKDYRQKIENNQCNVRFMINAEYKKGSDILDYNLVEGQPQWVGGELYETWDVPSFELDLDVIISNRTNNFDSDKISEEQFNE